MQLCLDKEGQQVYNYWKSSLGAPEGPDKTWDTSSWPCKSPQDRLCLSHRLSSVSFIILCLSFSFTSLLLFIQQSSHPSPALSGGLTPDEVQAYHGHVITTWLLQRYTPKPKSLAGKVQSETEKKEGMKWKTEMDRGRQTEERREECGKRMLEERRERDAEWDNLESQSYSPPRFLWGWWGMRWCWQPVSQPDLPTRDKYTFDSSIQLWSKCDVKVSIMWNTYTNTT